MPMSQTSLELESHLNWRPSTFRSQKAFKNFASVAKVSKSQCIYSR